MAKFDRRYSSIGKPIKMLWGPKNPAKNANSRQRTTIHKEIGISRWCPEPQVCSFFLPVIFPSVPWLSQKMATFRA